MKIIFNKNKLINSINISLKAIPTRTTEELLNCIHIRAYDDIYFTTNDGELWIKTKVQGNVVKEGEIAVNAKLFSDIVRKLPNEEIILEVINNQTVISSGISNFKISCMNLNGYSDVPSINEEYKMNIDSFSLKEMIRKTIFCTSQSENAGFMMSGEYIEIIDNKLKITAIDGSRIAICTKILDKRYEQNSCIVPGKALNEISKIISGETSDNVEIVITENHILFILSETIILSRLISGKFFNINKMLSADYELKINVNKNDIVDSVDRAMLLSRESDIQPLIINIDNSMELKIKSKLGEMKENVDIKKDTDKSMIIGLNPRFLLEALKAVDDEELDMYFINRIAPVFIKDAEETYIYILLPVNFVDED